MPQYIGDFKRKVVHNLENTKTECSISQIQSEDRVTFDSLEQANKAGYVNCQWCIGFKTPSIEPEEPEEEAPEEELEEEDELPPHPSEGPIEPDHH